jgi:hypothetical protein
LNTETAPKSASVSMHTSATPAVIHGRAMGKATRHAAFIRPKPSA